jgi:hypothetical protein
VAVSKNAYRESLATSSGWSFTNCAKGNIFLMKMYPDRGMLLNAQSPGPEI